MKVSLLQDNDYICEKSRNEKYRNMKNPFKFGTVVDGAFFTDREKELQSIGQLLESENHLVLISPRRFGKTSLVCKALQYIDRPVIMVNLQSVTTVAELAALLLKRVFKIYPFEKIKHAMTHFRFIPTFSVNPMTDGVDVAFQPGSDNNIVLEDVLMLIEKLGEKNKFVVVLDEFQEIIDLEKGLDKYLRSIMQLQHNVNYIFLGSQESMMEEIFEKKKSPFYHFGILMRLPKIPYDDFSRYLTERFAFIVPEQSEQIAKDILLFTQCHPYYTQQLAFQVWNILEQESQTVEVVNHAVDELTQLHDFDYERIWMAMNKTDRHILTILAQSATSPLDSKREMPTSTAFSALKRLSKQGYVIKNKKYEIDDPFFARWIFNRSL